MAVYKQAQKAPAWIDIYAQAPVEDYCPGTFPRKLSGCHSNIDMGLQT